MSLFACCCCVVMVRTKPTANFNASKMSLQKKDVQTSWKICGWGVELNTRSKSFTTAQQIIGADLYKRNIHGVVAAASPMSPYHWWVQFGGDVGELECKNKHMLKEPHKKRPNFPKMPQQSFNGMATSKSESKPYLVLSDTSYLKHNLKLMGIKSKVLNWRRIRWCKKR